MSYMDNSRSTGRPGFGTTAVVIMGVLNAALVLAAGYLGYRSAALANETESLRNAQSKIEAQVQENDSRTDELEKRINNVSTDDREDAADFLSGTWTGEYRCSQGVTGLELIIYVVDADNLLATFNFFPVASNPQVPKGSAAFKGSYTTSTFKLIGDYWIDQPQSYRLVDLSASFNKDGPKAIEGDVVSSFSECKRFKISKTSDETRKPPT